MMFKKINPLNQFNLKKQNASLVLPSIRIIEFRVLQDKTV